MNKTCRLFVLYLLVICSVSSGARRSRYLLKWQKFDCVNNFRIITNVSCWIEKNGRVSAEYELSEPMHELWIKYKMTVKRSIQMSETVLFDSAFDICQLFRDGVMKNKLVKLVLQNTMRDSNMAKKCPLNKGLLYFHNIAGLDQFPFFLPEMDFTLQLSFYRPNTTDALDEVLKGSITEQFRARNRFWH